MASKEQKKAGLIHTLLSPFRTNPFDVKESRVVSWVPLWQDKNPMWSPRDYASFAREGYKKVVWVYACVREIATSVSGIPWVLYEKRRSNEDGKVHLVEVEDHPVLDLIQRPNPWMSGQEFFEGWATFLNLAGNAYWELAELDSQKRPKELYLLRPDRIRIVPSRERFIERYLYVVNGKKIPLEVDEVIHFKYLDPLNDHYGMSPIEAAARTVDTENEAVDWNKVFFQNAARPDGALATEQELTDEQFERLEKQIQEDWQGTQNAHKPLLLEAGLKWIQMGLAQKDMDFSALRKMSREEICAVFGVPPILVGILDRATYSNYEEARRSFYEETIIPMLDRLKAKMNAEFISRYGSNLVLDYDLTSVTALQESQDALFKRLSGAVAQGLLTVNEARKELGYDPVPWGDSWWAPLNLYPVSSPKPPAIDRGEPAGEEPEESENGEGTSQSSVDMRFSTKMVALNLNQPEARKAYWMAFDRRRWGWEGRIAEEAKKTFSKEEKEALEALKDIHSQGDVALVVEKLRKSWEKRWQNVLAAAHVAVIEDFGTETMEGFGEIEKAQLGPESQKAWLFDVWAQGVQNWIATTVGTKVKGIVDTTLRFLKLELETGMSEGETIDELAGRVSNLWDMFTERRSVVIARTEVISASNAGSYFAAKQSNLPMKKEWLATKDKRVRDTHEKADGQVREMDEPFNVGRGKLMFPGDSSLGAPAEEVIQCRCTQTYVMS